MSMFAGSSQVNLYTLMPSIAFSAMMVGCREVGAGGGSVNFDTKLNNIAIYGIATVSSKSMHIQIPILLRIRSVSSEII